MFPVMCVCQSVHTGDLDVTTMDLFKLVHQGSLPAQPHPLDMFKLVPLEKHMVALRLKGFLVYYEIIFYLMPYQVTYCFK